MMEGSVVIDSLDEVEGFEEMEGEVDGQKLGMVVVLTPGSPVGLNDRLGWKEMLGR